MIEAPGLKEKLLIWFVRPFARRRRDEVPEGVTDEELIRLGKVHERRQTLLSYLALAPATLAIGGLWQVSGLVPERRPDDLVMRSDNPWLAAFVLAWGLCAVLGATPLSRLVGGAEADRAYRLAFEARHGVNLRRLLLICGLPLAALGAYVLHLCGAYLAFDDQALRWRDARGPERLMPLADIAEVRFYRRREKPDGRAALIGDAAILLRDGTWFVPKRDIDASIGLSPDECALLARISGVPARLDLDVLPFKEKAK